MNEQLVQELAVQIDGQIAQGCGSHDPNAKSSYIIQKYPQVRNCANYTEAVMMIAREQAALQAPQTGFSQPQPSFGQRQSSIGQLQSGFGQPQQAGGFGQPQQFGGFGQQPQGFGQPQQDFGMTQQSFGQAPPPGLFGQPAIPQTGQVGASQFTAFQPPKASKASNGKVLGFIPPKVFAVVVISIVAIIVIGGIGVSIKNAINPKQPKPNTQIEQNAPTTPDDLFDDLFDD